MDLFAKEKKDFLKKADKSKKGSIDGDVVKLIESINSKGDYYTTSSCAGRIVLIEIRSNKKNECEWIFTKHDKVKLSEVEKALCRSQSKHEVWFKQQPLILHVACRNLEAAKRFLAASRILFKKAGIIGITDRKIMAEIIGSEHLETVVKDENFVVDKMYLKELIRYANRNFGENKRKIERLMNLMDKI